MFCIWSFKYHLAQVFNSHFSSCSREAVLHSIYLYLSVVNYSWHSRLLLKNIHLSSAYPPKCKFQNGRLSSLVDLICCPCGNFDVVVLCFIHCSVSLAFFPGLSPAERLGNPLPGFIHQGWPILISAYRVGAVKGLMLNYP